jgi:transcriptional regulator with XRE-family HTH domain
MDLERIKSLLQDRRLSIIAKATGLSTLTVANIRDGETKNPSYETIKKLNEYFVMADDVESNALESKN